MYAPLVARLPIATYFMLAGYSKFQNSREFVIAVQGFGILPEPLATLYGILLPYVEMVIGALLFLGLWTTLCAIVTSLMLLSFIIALGVYQGKPFNKDIVLLGLSLSLLYSGAGAWSIDRFRKTG